MHADSCEDCDPHDLEDAVMVQSAVKPLYVVDKRKERFNQLVSELRENQVVCENMRKAPAVRTSSATVRNQLSKLEREQSLFETGVEIDKHLTHTAHGLSQSIELLEQEIKLVDKRIRESIQPLHDGEISKHKMQMELQLLNLSDEVEDEPW